MDKNTCAAVDVTASIGSLRSTFVIDEQGQFERARPAAPLTHEVYWI
jgi:hypothetical protein